MPSELDMPPHSPNRIFPAFQRRRFTAFGDRAYGPRAERREIDAAVSDSIQTLALQPQISLFWIRVDPLRLREGHYGRAIMISRSHFIWCFVAALIYLTAGAGL